ncbi:hypothetical protein L228DRAFT_266556 [Xylona heveae TC161]|uniref:Uncharacterized protein n=1 Tax=Xylona heveae (strain CBS 132557 / TC161) TaxID=1328760 RepID=A0A165I0S9_XYLHT|nr:hypothetical protein L228DRAFT_266556 [Xylona heveae TC161]KZF24199.1 hypothetical protein L228DRAFT_266556 [Xylona heveae TC161]
MSRFFPHTPYAEDQPLFKTILATHVLYRGFQAGTVVGSLVGTARSLLMLRGTSKLAVLATVAPTTILRSAGTGALIGTAAMVVGLPARMWGREEIEWRDRSWRLLENQGQLETDDWSVAGTLLAAVYATLKVPKNDPYRLRKIIGGTGLGSMAGVIGYMTWRYGINGGKR